MKKTIYLLLIGIFSLCSCLPSSEKNKETIQNESASTVAENTIINLYDAFGKPRDGLIKDFGFSALIKYNGKLILFDAGTNADILKNNTKTLGIDLKEVDFAVGSHAHGDHLDGFDYLLEVNPDVKIYLPFDSQVGAKINFNIAGREKAIIDSLPEEMKYFGGEGNYLNPIINYSGRFRGANIEYIKDNKELEQGINLIATQSLYLGYASKYPNLTEMQATENDEIQFEGLPELSLLLSTKEGEVLIVGCSHSSIQKIINESKSLTKNEISLLYGGYHLLPYDRSEINSIASQLKNEFGIKKIAPTHCTGHLAFKLLNDAYGKDYIFAGLGERTVIQN